MKIKKTILALGVAAAMAAVPFAANAEAPTMSASVSMPTRAAARILSDECEHDYISATHNPTCTERGYTEYVCSLCGDSYFDGYTAAKGHSFSTIAVAPTCEDRGFTTHVCLVCGYQYSDNYIDELGHEYSDIVYDPTCVKGGYTVHVCDVCGDEYKDSVVPALGHTYSEDVVEPDCLKGGFTTFTCEVCGDSYVDDYTEALGHAYTETKHDATCIAYGYTEHECSECGDRYVTDYRKPLGHNYKTEVVAATVSEMGYTKHTCRTCGYSYLSDFSASGDSGYIEDEPVIEHTHSFAATAAVDRATRTISLKYNCACGESALNKLSVVFEDNNGVITEGVIAANGKVSYPENTAKVSVLNDVGVTVRSINLVDDEPTDPEPVVPDDPTPDVPIPDTPIEEHTHNYSFSASFDSENNIVKLNYICECKDNKVTGLAAIFTDEKGNKTSIMPGEDGEVDLTRLDEGKYLLGVYNDVGILLDTYEVTISNTDETDEQPSETEKPGESAPDQPETPDEADKPGETEKPDDNPEKPDETEKPDEQPTNTKKGSSVAGILGIILLVLGIGGVVAFIVIRRKKNKNKNN